MPFKRRHPCDTGTAAVAVAGATRSRFAKVTQPLFFSVSLVSAVWPAETGTTRKRAPLCALAVMCRAQTTRTARMSHRHEDRAYACQQPSLHRAHIHARPRTLSPPSRHTPPFGLTVNETEGKITMNLKKAHRHKQDGGRRRRRGRCGGEKADRCKRCDNCNITESPVFRRGGPSRGTLLCNACSVYYRKYRRMRDPHMEYTFKPRPRKNIASGKRKLASTHAVVHDGAENASASGARSGYDSDTDSSQSIASLMSAQTFLSDDALSPAAFAISPL